MAKHRANRNTRSYNDVRSHRAMNVGHWDDEVTRKHRMKDNDSGIRKIAQHFKGSFGAAFSNRKRDKSVTEVG